MSRKRNIWEITILPEIAVGKRSAVAMFLDTLSIEPGLNSFFLPVNALKKNME